MQRVSPSNLLLLTTMLMTWVCACVDSQAEEGVDYVREIQPILADHCFECHGQDPSSREADLRLDKRDVAVASINGDPAIVPGEAAKSILMERIESDDPDLRMPPPEHGDPLTEEERMLLRRWIDQGAEYREHWAFIPPVKAACPTDVHPIDFFVHQQLAATKLTPNPQADRATLLRRLSLDLTGLPPTPEQLDAFLADDAPDAYAKQVERLLQSPQYGERWARWWLDAARYSDSDGYEKDLPRKQWPWRDWVIEALNNDLPYDTFITEQLAGDLLPDAAQDEHVATGFLRNGMVNEEGAIIAEEFRMEGLIDRMDCLGKAVLGLTIACAQCHDHKYDPISTREYYQLMAYINNDYEAVSRVYGPDHRKTIDSIEKNIAAKEEAIKQAAPDWEAKLATWIEAQREALMQPQWQAATPTSAEVPDGICHPELLPDKSVLNLGFRPTSTRLTVLLETPETTITGLRLCGLKHGDLIFGGPGRSYVGNFAISEIKVEACSRDSDAYEKVKVKSASADSATHNRLIDPYLRRNAEDSRMVGGAGYLIDGIWETAWTPDRGGHFHNEPCEAVLQFEQPITHEPGTKFRIVMEFRHGGNDAHGRKNNFIGRFRFDVTGDETPKAAAVTGEVRQALERDEANRSDSDNRLLLTAWAATDERTKSMASAIQKQWKRWPEGDSVPHLATRDGEYVRETRILDRGSWQSPGSQVSAGVPASLHAISAEQQPPNRLTLARWLTDSASPTTARVAVNRIWQSYFGTGLVETTDDFGVRSALPSHPELLDWLAVEFMQPALKTGQPSDPWSLKHLHRVIVSSDTYQQSAVADPKAIEIDPQNRLLARGPRFRVDAEMVRDIALAASGLLKETVGGPSVFPPVPDGLFSLSFTAVDFWDTAKDDERYRRSLYVFRRRSIPDPVLASFDAPSGDASCVRRTYSNTPLAALTSLNATIFTEAAQAMALRLLGKASVTDRDRLIYGYRLCASRHPTTSEIDALMDLLEVTRNRLTSGELTAAEIAFNTLTKPSDLPPTASPNEAAAWTIVCRVLLNLDATLSKG
ncbi:MAG: PSD1 and planctomycete cytochrome C domain-containing protein [Planctomycetota bacterium]|nr:PSD1 and planctomycete cytochrome C domain-containing protein [Planctomycetota bacterium]